jgi:hypothetical protein
MENLADLLTPSSKPTKSYTQLLQEGVPHKGGLAQLAAAETMENPPPCLAALQRRSSKATSD